ncbi:MAG TPA: aldo/keto reductase [Aggregatilineaceae bacterium]|nr:aldo/keto reductase [Aggregatilineaceae bacterium]
MEQRRLGRTGHKSTVVIMGTAAFYTIDQGGASAALDLVLEHGVNHIDVAPQYGNAQAVVGPWLESRRDRFFLGCKTLERTRDAAWAELNDSLTLLRTSVIDLYQVHAVTTQQDLDQIFAPGGAIEAFVQARDEGLVRYLGITGHGMLAPTLQAAALERLPFDTVMFPINPRLYSDTKYRRDAERLLRLCQDRDVGVQIIKSIAKGPWGDKSRIYNPWYEPYDIYAKIESGVRFALSQPGVTGIASAAEVRLLPLVIRAAENFKPLAGAEQAALIEEHASDEAIFMGPTALSKD